MANMMGLYTMNWESKIDTQKIFYDFGKRRLS